MSRVISDHLQRFEKQILSLVPYASNDRLEYLVKKLLPDENTSRHLAVKNEIKKLAQQSKKSIDLRSLFADCEVIEYNNVIHYIDAAGKEFFQRKLIEYQNLYTIGLYHEVYEDAQQRASYKKKSIIAGKASAFTVDKTEPKPLVNQNRIVSELKKLDSACKVFVNPIMGMTTQGKKEVGITASIEKMNNQKVVIQTSNALKNITADTVYLWLFDHHSEIDFTEELELGFIIVDRQKYKLNNTYEYLLKFSSPLTDQQMRVLFAHYLRQKKLAIIGPTERFIEPLFDSITSKGYEQLYLNKTHDIPLLCYKSDNIWHAKIAMKTSGNDELWNFFSDEKQHFHLPVLLGNKDIQQALNERKTVEKYALLLKSSLKDSYTYSLIWYDDLIHNRSVKTVFNNYFKNSLFRVVKISSSFVNSAEDAYVPSALPSHVHPKMAVLNRAIPKAALDMISDCDHLITVSDITSLYETIYQPVSGEITELANLLPQRFQLSAVDDLCDTEIELTVPFKEKDRILTKQKYIVLGYDRYGAVRLLMNAIESKHLACRAIRKYIYQHIDSIEACGKRGSRIYGLQKAMRNIYAHNHFSIPFYLKANKHQQYINAASFSGNSALKHLVYKNENSEEIILNLLSNKKFRDSCLSIIAVLAYKGLPARAFYILVLPKENEESEEYSFWYRDLAVLKKSSQLQEYTNKVSSHGKPAILKVELKKSDKVQNMYYRDEITYLKTLDKDLAKDLEVQLYNTIGIGEVTDLTDIAIKMINNGK